MAGTAASSGRIVHHERPQPDDRRNVQCAADKRRWSNVHQNKCKLRAETRGAMREAVSTSRSVFRTVATPKPLRARSSAPETRSSQQIATRKTLILQRCRRHPARRRRQSPTKAGHGRPAVAGRRAHRQAPPTLRVNVHCKRGPCDELATQAPNRSSRLGADFAAKRSPASARADG